MSHRPLALHEKESKQQVIVQHNDLITARYILGIDGLRLLLLLLSKVNQRGDNPGLIKITIREFQEAFGIPNKNVYRCINNAISALWEGSIEIYVQKERMKALRISRWITDQTYIKEDGKHVVIEITLNPKLDPFLFNMATNFTWTNFEFIQNIRSVTSFRLYMYLISCKNHPLCKRNGFFEVSILIDDFKTLFSTNCARFFDLKKKSIDPAIQDINTYSNISVHCKTVKEGRSVVALRFGCVEEKASINKPKRPRLAKRPHVKTGSHAEGEWMQKNTEILYQYEKALKGYDPTLRLDMPDLRRAVEYSRLFKPNWHREKKKELEQRAAK
ncbi:gp45 [Sodalis phage phiSG1]|uniref:replication initiation protein n=1 Tax=Sodalis phage phiSG1 TaxID=373126 RepID=UPI00006C5C0F|nr:replication initiation protein [Sodalis phage phiSG1]ABN42249.1 gp45 [Sodalis phage phiSG1]BAE80508.1 putative replication protein [Sodalis phage phiSG1]